MNWRVVWYIDFADWSVILPCIEAMQACIKFLSRTRSFTQYVLIQYQNFAKTVGFCSAGHIYRWQGGTKGHLMTIDTGQNIKS